MQLADLIDFKWIAPLIIAVTVFSVILRMDLRTSIFTSTTVNMRGVCIVIYIKCIQKAERKSTKICGEPPCRAGGGERWYKILSTN